MSKRFGKDFSNDISNICKKPRLEITRCSEPQISRRVSSSKPRTSTGGDDEWGDDFGEAELEEIDMIASQACSQEVNSSLQCINPQPGPSNLYRQNSSFPSNTSPTTADINASFNQPRFGNNYATRSKDSHKFDSASTSQSVSNHKQPQASQILSSSNTARRITDDAPALNEFKKNIMMNKNLNSTFHMKNSIITESDEVALKKREQLELEYKKLLNDFTLKDGETIFLRQQLQQTQIKASKESMEKTKLMEQQAGEFRKKIDGLHKESQSLKTQYELQSLQLNQYIEKYRMLESGKIKLNSAAKNSPNISKNRSVTFKATDVYIQTESIYPKIYYLMPNSESFPFKKIPQQIFELSMPEKAIVDIQVVNRSGKRNLPILQDEQTFRIFENPNIVKPIVTTIDGKHLSIEFIQSDIAKLINKSMSGVHSKETILIINKIVAVTRELLLNLITVLEAIKAAMNNDDVRDMNDIYFSNFYDIHVNYNQSLFESGEWHDKERGIEARRALAMLCYIAEKSKYLCEYIAGKTVLSIEDDLEYHKTNQQMIRYNQWPDRKNNYEMLEIILKFVAVFNSVRRAHQFTGLICAICNILKNVQRIVGFKDRGLTYVSNIFKELVYSRPLVRCLISMTEMMVEFSQCNIFIKRLINSENRQALHVWKNILNFTEDACVLKIYINQFKGFKFDEITTITMTYELILFTDIVFRSNILPWPSESNNDYDCCIELLTLVVKMLYECMKIDLNRAEQKFDIKQKIIASDNSNNYYNKLFWHELMQKQINCMKIGVRFLSYLTKRDPEFLIRSIDIDTPFFLYIENVTTIPQLKWHEIDQDALQLIKSIFVSDKPLTPDCSAGQIRTKFDIKTAFDKKIIPTSTTGVRKEFRKNPDEQHEMTEMFTSLLQI